MILLQENGEDMKKELRNVLPLLRKRDSEKQKSKFSSVL